ncbi:MAG TPA: lysophospholipid acyltransferase family protein [Steroidobacteraceae bacterium]|nr:lysophospholipid acyltransferase family protein [Steroidobacteraceae bacterium]
MQFIGSLLFTSFLFVWTFCYGLAFAIVANFIPYRRRFALARFWGQVLLGALKLLCRLDYRVEGRENLPAGHHVAYWKHSSTWETFAQAVVFPPQAWVFKRELMWLPFVGWGLKLLRGIAINRSGGGSAVRQVVEQGTARLNDGMWVVIFPEGTRMPPGETRRYGISGALLAVESGHLIVPVAHDAGYYWRRRAFVKKPGTIVVRIGPPIVCAGRDPREVNAEAQAWIEKNSTH